MTFASFSSNRTKAVNPPSTCVSVPSITLVNDSARTSVRYSPTRTCSPSGVGDAIATSASDSSVYTHERITSSVLLKLKPTVGFQSTSVTDSERSTYADSVLATIRSSVPSENVAGLRSTNDSVATSVDNASRSRRRTAAVSSGAVGSSPRWLERARIVCWFPSTHWARALASSSAFVSIECSCSSLTLSATSITVVALIAVINRPMSIAPPSSLSAYRERIGSGSNDSSAMWDYVLFGGYAIGVYGLCI